ncbi:MAG TPA: HlyD family efflux transporter periplasmic adaptor subunit [Vicinamibacterales bacterium]|nr:HlyD family efflux transporter periplasmic adaptor subunit [Vicinamibacterales bacterium]
MDIARPSSVARNKRRRRIFYFAGGLVAVALITLGLSRLKPAAPTVDRSTVWIDTVKRGSMLRQVRGLGTLVPEDITWIPATTDGRVERILIYPGTPVKPDSVILLLSNQQLQQQAEDAELQLKAAEADLASLRVKLANDTLAQQSSVAQVQSDYTQAQMQATVNEELTKEQLLAALITRQSIVKAEQLKTQLALAKAQLNGASRSTTAQVAAQEAKVDQLRALYRLRQSQVEALKVRAGIAGVLQAVPVDVGQRVTDTTNLARVVDPTKLKAELKIAETQAKDIQIGQLASIDTRNGVVEGHVSRIDPAVQNGTVTVDVRMQGPLPRGARPDLSVDGTIQLERLTNVLYVGRPAFGQENSTVGLFKLVDGGDEAVRTQVKLGRSSVNTVEILGGLKAGDQVILSDMSAWDAVDRVRLK